MNAVDSVRRLYEKHPYPGTSVGASLIEDMVGALWFLFPRQDLADWKILDAGCGSGHRLIAAAKAYPRAQFTGLDMSNPSLEVARQLQFSIPPPPFWKSKTSGLRCPIGR